MRSFSTSAQLIKWYLVSLTVHFNRLNLIDPFSINVTIRLY